MRTEMPNWQAHCYATTTTETTYPTGLRRKTPPRGLRKAKLLPIVIRGH